MIKISNSSCSFASHLAGIEPATTQSTARRLSIGTRRTKLSSKSLKEPVKVCIVFQSDHSPSAAACSGLVLDQANSSAMHFGAIQLFDSVLHVRVTIEIDDTHVAFPFVGVGVCDFACLTHEVLEVLFGVEGN